MKFEKLSQSTLKVTLTTSELEDCNISPTEIIGDNEKAKQLLCRLVLLGAGECGFQPDSERYIVEVFYQSDICIIYISSVECRKQSNKNYIMCRTKSIDDIASLCDVICRIGTNMCRTSLYSDKNGIMLIAKCIPQISQRLENLFREFGEVHRLSHIEFAEICERCDVLFEKRAAENIKKLFRT